MRIQGDSLVMSKTPFFIGLNRSNFLLHDSYSLRSFGILMVRNCYEVEAFAPINKKMNAVLLIETTLFAAVSPEIPIYQW